MKLPSVYANKIDKKIDNNDSSYKIDRNNDIDVYRLKDYFDNGYANKLLVEIESNGEIIKERLILCKDDYVVNIDNKKIYFKDIKNFRIIK